MEKILFALYCVGLATALVFFIPVVIESIHLQRQLNSIKQVEKELARRQIAYAKEELKYNK